MRVNIRKTRKEDIKNLWELEKESRLHHKKLRNWCPKLNFSSISQKSKKNWVNDFKKRFDSDKNISFIALIDGKAVGYNVGIIFKWNWTDGKGFDVAELQDMAVLKKFNNKGIGDKLIKRFERWAKSKNFYGIMLNVDNKNESAIALYHKNSFKNLYVNMFKRLK